MPRASHHDSGGLHRARQAGLRESDAWPAHPQDAYGLEKIVSEECCRWWAVVSSTAP